MLPTPSNPRPSARDDENPRDTLRSRVHPSWAPVFSLATQAGPLWGTPYRTPHQEPTGGDTERQGPIRTRWHLREVTKSLSLRCSQKPGHILSVNGQLFNIFHSCSPTLRSEIPCGGSCPPALCPARLHREAGDSQHPRPCHAASPGPSQGCVSLEGNEEVWFPSGGTPGQRRDKCIKQLACCPSFCAIGFIYSK